LHPTELEEPVRLRSTLLPMMTAALMACGKDDDSAATDDTAPLPQAVSEVRASLHETIESIVRVEWTQDIPGETWLEFSVDGETWLESPREHHPTGLLHDELLLGVPYDSEVSYRILVEPVAGVIDEGEGPLVSATHSITTGAQPEGVPTLELHAMDPEALDPDTHYVLGSIDVLGAMGTAIGTWSFVFDRQGRVVWAWETPFQRATIHARVARTGTEFLIDYGSFYAIYDGGAASQVARLKIDGTEVALYDTPGLHHPFTYTPDGGLLWGAHNAGMNTLRQMSPDGTVTDIWSCAEFYDEIKYDEHGNYCASNTVTWDDASGHVLFSLYSSDSVVEIDPASGESLRWFGHIPEAWSFAPEDSAFWWQHGVHYTEQGTMLVSAKETRNGTETVVREYELDEDSQALVQIWSFGDGEGVYGPEMGEAHRLGNGNTLHNYGSGARVREVTPAGELVWDLTFSSGTYLGRTTPIADLYAFAP
jgi:hypothetical protein